MVFVNSMLTLPKASDFETQIEYRAKPSRSPIIHPKTTPWIPKPLSRSSVIDAHLAEVEATPQKAIAFSLPAPSRKLLRIGVREISRRSRESSLIAGE